MIDIYKFVDVFSSFSVENMPISKWPKLEISPDVYTQAFLIGEH